MRYFLGNIRPWLKKTGRLTNIYYVMMALLGSAFYSAGVILQKKGSGWMERGNRRPRNTRSLFALWSCGMVVSYALSAVPLAVASTRLAPHIISALSGLSIAAVAVLSYVFLREKLYVSDIFYSLLIIGCIAALSLTSSDVPAASMNVKPLALLLAVPLVLLPPVFAKHMGRKRKVVLLAVFSGFESGLAVVLMNVLAKEFNSLCGLLFRSPYLYLYLAVGLLSVAAAQAAYRIGEVVLFTPVQVVSAMGYPLACSFLLFSASVKPLHILLVFLMAAACWGIQRKR